MVKQILHELRKRLTIGVVIPCFLFIIALLVFGIYRGQSYSLRDSLDFYGLILSGVPAITFPILAVLIYVSFFAGEIRNRFLVYTRMRRSIFETLVIKQVSNIVLSFLFFFLFVFIPFIYVYYIDPKVGNTVFDPSLYGLTSKSVITDSYSRHTFSNFLQHGTLTFGLVYSFWVGINGALYAAVSFYLVLLVRNSFLALSLPFVLYIVISFILSAVKLNDFRPNHVIFPFEHTQSPLWTVSIPFIILLFITIFLSAIVKKKIDSMVNTI